MVNLPHEVSDRLDPEIEPPDEARIGIVADFDIGPGIEAGFLFERRHGVVIKARPTVFPTFKMCHPVWYVHVDPINSRSRNLAHALHVSLAPLGSIGADPNVLVAGGNPKGRAPAKDRRLAGKLPLNPIGVVFKERVRPLGCVGSDALQPGNVNECIITRCMGLLCDGFDGT